MLAAAWLLVACAAPAVPVGDSGPAGATELKRQEEVSIMADRGSPSRRPPAEVAPIVVDGVRYEQVRDTTGIETTDHNGWMRATSLADGAVLWTRQVYKVNVDPNRSGGGNWVYFRSMTLSDDGRAIIVENEAGKRFRVDTGTGDSTPLN